MDNYTPRAQAVIKASIKEAIRLKNKYVLPEHIMVSILNTNKGEAINILKDLGIKIDLYEEVLIKFLKQQEKIKPGEEVLHSNLYVSVLKDSSKIAEKYNHSYVGTEHLFLSIVENIETFVYKSFKNEGITKKEVIELFEKRLDVDFEDFNKQTVIAGNREKEKNNKETKLKYLNDYAVNLNEKCKLGQIDKIIGREKEISRVITILSRKKKNNPVLLGEAGTGKTAIAEGLALSIIENNVPSFLKDSIIYSVDLGLLVAGTKYRGDFEKRIKGIMEEVKENKNIIIFLDEIHTVIGAGSAEGTMDAANILKPALARGELRCIGATTLDEYNTYIEKDPALERRFQSVSVSEPTEEEAINILNGLKESYEKFHRVIYSKESLINAVKLSELYIKNRYLPDKAIDIIDEAGAKAKINKLEGNEEIKDLNNKLKKIITDKNFAVSKQKYELAAKIKKEEEGLKNEIVKVEKRFEEMVPNVEVKHIKEIVSSWSGVPIEDLSENDKDSFVKLDSKLKCSIIGQNEAIEKVCKTIKKSKTPFKNKNKPIGGFVFAGSHGLGKTYLAKKIAENIFGNEKRLISLDMSEFKDSISVNKLIGASAGYVGYEEGGSLCNNIKKQPYSVVLFDEIEKAHQDVIDILLQILEEGRLTDNKGNSISFSNTVIILTTNIGVTSSVKTLGFSSEEEKDSIAKEKIKESIKGIFRPELIDRLDDIIVFNYFSKDEMLKILDLNIEEINKNLIDYNIKIKLTKRAKEFLIQEGFSKKSGARSLNRLINDKILNVITDDFILGNISNNSEIRFDLKGSTLNYSIKNAKQEVL